MGNFPVGSERNCIVLVAVKAAYFVCVCVCVCLYTHTYIQIYIYIYIYICVCMCVYIYIYIYTYIYICRSQWPRGLRHKSAAARLLRSWVQIPPRAWKFVCCECCLLAGRGLCDELITHPESRVHAVLTLRPNLPLMCDRWR